jgi:ACS family hexuronate transporter-like MFS transporter
MMLFGPFIGFVLQMTHGNYVPIFIMAGSAYLAALLFINVLSPNLRPLDII